jgi:carbonic anhydrase/acetyltransferase-like protein (isoleucine patch superfamily)
MIHRINDKHPKLDQPVFVAWNAEVAGDVALGKDCSVWFAATLRGDLAPIRVGTGTNLQDGCVVHVDSDVPTTVGKHVTVGHRAVLHGCTVEDGCLVGMGAVILNGAVIGEGSIVGAGALVTEGKQFPPGSLIIGMPARAVRQVTDAEREHIRENVRHYVELGRQAPAAYHEVDE